MLNKDRKLKFTCMTLTFNLKNTKGVFLWSAVFILKVPFKGSKFLFRNCMETKVFYTGSIADGHTEGRTENFALGLSNKSLLA